MNPTQNNTFYEKQKLQKLNFWLSFEIRSVGIFALHFFLPMGLVLSILVTAAIIFLPFMLLILIQLRKFGWLIIFFVFVAPPLLLDLIKVENTTYEWILRGFSLAFFYFYCFTLKYSVKERLNDLSSINKIAGASS